MRKVAILLVAVGAMAVLVGGATSALGGHAAKTKRAVIGLGSVKGNYAFSDTFHDAINGQDGAAAGSIVFDGLGGVKGVYSQNARCSNPCGDQLVTRADFTGTYTVNADGSTTIDICINNPSTTVRVIWQGAFASGFHSLRFIQTQLASPCTDPLTTQPNVTSGTGDKL
jgi:hypothetical protein